jgi:hypothetical protein
VTASEATLFIPVWLVVALLLGLLFYAGWPIYVRPRLVRWRKRRRNARRLGI